MGNSQQCPVCHSTRVRVGRVRSASEFLHVCLGDFPSRCEDCSARFQVRGGGLGVARFAECPHCLRQDLSIWDLKHYRATRWMRLQMLVGAHRWRCEVCRCNFVSLRPRKEKYVRPSDRLAVDRVDQAAGTPV